MTAETFWACKCAVVFRKEKWDDGSTCSENKADAVRQIKTSYYNNDVWGWNLAAPKAAGATMPQDHFGFTKSDLFLRFVTVLWEWQWYESWRDSSYVLLSEASTHNTNAEVHCTYALMWTSFYTMQWDFSHLQTEVIRKCSVLLLLPSVRFSESSSRIGGNSPGQQESV